MSNNNTPSKAEALQALAFIEDIWDLAPDLPYTKKLRAFISGAPDNQPQGELNATRLDTNDRATAGNRGARPDLQHIARDGHEPGSSGVESHPLRGGDGMVVGDITPSTRPGCAGVHLPLDASAASAPLGWLYDWTHSSALGKPDERFTSFTTDEAHARKHDNPRPVWGAPDAANAGEPAARTEFCWLVELFKPEGNSMGYYHTGFTDLSGQSRTTKNPQEARRYTKARAEAVAAKLHHLAGVWRAVEHGFATPTGVAADESTRAPDGELPEPEAWRGVDLVDVGVGTARDVVLRWEKLDERDEPLFTAEQMRAYRASGERPSAPHRPSREWYAGMITETLNDDITIGPAPELKGDCPHATPPFRYCDGCKVTPCPIGLGSGERPSAPAPEGEKR